MYDHFIYSTQVVPAAVEFKYLSSRSAMKSTMGLKFKSGQETRYENSDNCQIPVKYTQRKDDRTFIEET